MKDVVLYVCDRRACHKCYPECHHTSDISHAVHFVRFPTGAMIEKHPADDVDDDIYFRDGAYAVKDPTDPNRSESSAL